MSNRKVALITGASQGIGRDIAIKMASEGYDIILNYHSNVDTALEVSKKCEEYGAEVLCIQADVSKFNAVGEMVNQIMDKFGHIDILVNNSGITKDNLLLRMSEEDFDDVIDVNLKGTFNCIKHVSKIMMKERSGVIINMSSVVGLTGNAGQANYAASKAGVIGLTKSVARELAPRAIRVNAVAPGFIKTKMTEVLDDKTKEAILNNIPLREFGSTEDVANMVCFLASEKCKYVTGQVFNVDGGMLI